MSENDKVGQVLENLDEITVVQIKAKLDELDAQIGRLEAQKASLDQLLVLKGEKVFVRKKKAGKKGAADVHPESV